MGEVSNYNNYEWAFKLSAYIIFSRFVILDRTTDSRIMNGLSGMRMSLYEFFQTRYKRGGGGRYVLFWTQEYTYCPRTLNFI